MTGFEGNIEKIEKAEGRQNGIIVTIFITKPITKIPEMSDKEQKQFIKEFKEIHLGKCILRQPNKEGF